MRKIIVDSHCDSALKFYQGEGINSKNNQFKLDQALEYDKYIQFFAAYIEPEYIKTTAYDLALLLINTVKQKINIYKDKMMLILNRYELEKYLHLDKKMLGCIISIEDGSALDGKLENLDKLYSIGVRILGLTWNVKNQIASGADIDKKDSEDKKKIKENSEDGLTEFGNNVVEKMNQLNMIIDVSHLSKKSFYDVISKSTKPVIATHSNSQTICNNVRNLSDDQIKKISDCGGMIGLNLYKNFVSNDIKLASVDKLVEHIEKIEEIAGIDCIGIGSDFDGMSSPIDGLEDNSKFGNLILSLQKHKYSDDKIEKILGLNYINFLKRNLK